jgi:hypothetical protein
MKKNASKKSAVPAVVEFKELKCFLNSKKVQRFAKKHAGMEGQVSVAFVLEMKSGCTVTRHKPLFTVKAEA